MEKTFFLAQTAMCVIFFFLKTLPGFFGTGLAGTRRPIVAGFRTNRLLFHISLKKKFILRKNRSAYVRRLFKRPFLFSSNFVAKIITRTTSEIVPFSVRQNINK